MKSKLPSAFYRGSTTADSIWMMLKKNVAMLALFVTSNFFLPSIAKGQNLPAGFNQVLVANGIPSPTVMAFAPDGRLFVAQQNGQLRIIKNGALLVQPFISLAVNYTGERGLLGIAFDPAFASNQFIYLYYTLSSGANNRVSRFTASGDVAVAGSEVPILDLDPLSSATNHNGGTLAFGPDGKLYIGVGENANRANSQLLSNYLGKVLRINSDGSVPAGNPFTGPGAQQRIWGYGFRNPYTLTFQPGTNRLFINDVGENTWEEINSAIVGGGNYGWPNAEGFSSNTAYRNPVYAYAHGSAIGQGCAITGGTFFNPASTNYPSSYIGRYFYIDFCGNWIDMLTLSGSTATRSNFASSIAGSPVSIVTGPDGNLYFLSRATSAVYKITYTPSQSTITLNPVADAHVRDGSYANTNYGAFNWLTTNRSTTVDKTFQAYIRFDIASLPTNSSSVKLRLYGYEYYATDPSVVVQVFNVPSNTWAENTITYNLRPAAQNTVLASATVAGTTPKYYEWDLTAFINSQRLAGATAVSLQVSNLTTTNYNQLNFYSRERTTNKPELVAVVGGLRPEPTDMARQDIEIAPVSIFVYPNPAKSYLNITLPADVDGGVLQVTDINGRVMLKQVITQKSKMTLETFDLRNGSYIVTIEKAGKKYSKRFIIEN
jgi:glucose/arabinose dehydrogenase